MDSLELLRKLQKKDNKAVEQLVQQYGKALYERLRLRLRDKSSAEYALKKTMAELCTRLSEHKDVDVLELLLNMQADQVCSTMTDAPLDCTVHKAVERMGLEREAEKALPRMPAALMAAPAAPIALPAETPAAEESEEEAEETVQPAEETPVAAETVDAAGKSGETRRRKKGRGWLVFLLCLMVILVLWIAAGLAMDIGFIPHVNLGHQWVLDFFNQLF